jgi:hypothetical protein
MDVVALSGATSRGRCDSPGSGASGIGDVSEETVSFTGNERSMFTFERAGEVGIQPLRSKHGL